jgi:hypothetical protein
MPRSGTRGNEEEKPRRQRFKTNGKRIAKESNADVEPAAAAVIE